MSENSQNGVWNIHNKLFNFFSLWVERSTQTRQCYNPHTFWTSWFYISTWNEPLFLLRTLSYQLSPMSYPVCLHQRSCLLAKFHPSAGCHILPRSYTVAVFTYAFSSSGSKPSGLTISSRGYTNPVGCGLPHLPSLVSQTKCDDRRSVTSSGTQPFLLYGCIPDGMERQLERPSDIRTMVAPESQCHIHWLELEAIRLALLHWGLQWRSQSVRVYCENSTAVVYIRKQGEHILSPCFTRPWNCSISWISLW